MKDVDMMVLNDLVSFRQRALEGLKSAHPHMFAMVNALVSGKKNRVGLEVTQGGKSVGQYTLYLDGIAISHIEPGKLDPLINHPILGGVRIYGIMERDAMERALADQELLEKPLASIGKYLPEITIKFLP